MSVFIKATHEFADHIGALTARITHASAKIGKTITAISEVHAESVKLQREMYKTYGLRAD